MANNYLTIFSYFFDTLFPNRCQICGAPLKSGGYICNSCELNIEYIKGNTCRRCGAPVSLKVQKSDLDIYSENIWICSNCRGFNFRFNINESLYVYSGILRELIHMYKFEKRWRLYKYFSEKLIEYKLEYIEKHDYIVAVPLSKSRLKKRGYNQSSLIADEISKRSGIKYLKNAIKRRGSSKPQSLTNSFKERYINMTDKITLNHRYEDLINNKNILLFDDILTTGITASECAKALYDNNAKNVNLLTIARTLR